MKNQQKFPVSVKDGEKQMDYRKSVKNFEHSEDFSEPQKGLNVYPNQWCPMFSARRTNLGLPHPECFYCKYADFHLDKEVCLDVGKCCYPKVQIN